MFPLLLPALLLAAAFWAVVLIVALTLSWLIDKIKDRLKRKETKKIAVMDLEELIAEEEELSSQELADLNEMKKKGDVIIISLDSNGEVQDPEIIKDKNKRRDKKAYDLINRRGDGTMVIDA